MSLTFYGGVGEIGGNQILLRDGDTAVFFDFGIPFARRSLYFEEYLKPRSGAGLLDPLELGLIPPLRGIYREDLLTGESLRQRFSPAEEISLAGVILSHAHIDHSGYVSFLREDVPVYATALTAFIAKALQDSGGSDFEKEVCYANVRSLKDGYLSSGDTYRQRSFVFVDSPELPDQARQFWEQSPAKRKKLEPCLTSQSPDRIGKLPLRYFPVDHSIPGAAAFAVETSRGWVGYTGDLRFHGRAGGNTRRFVEEMAALHPYILLCEGSRAGDQRHITEAEVYDNALTRVKEAAGKLAVADFGPRNVERLLTFRQIAQQTSRHLVILAKDAYLLEAMALVSQDVPSLADCPDILIYQDLKGRLVAWEQKLRERHSARLVAAPQIRAQPGDFVLCFSFWDINDLIDIAPQGGLYLYSSSEAYTEEQEIDMRRLHHWVEHFGMRFAGDPGSDEKLHASGHASGPELLEMVRTISPRILIPIHTEQPEYFWQNLRGSGIEVILTSLNEGIQL